MQHVRGDIDSLALNLVGPPSVVPYAADDGANIAPRHGDGLAIVEGLNGGQELRVLLCELGELDQKNAALLGGGLAPGGLEGLPGGGDSKINILLVTLAHGADDLLCCGVDDLEGLLVDSLHPLVVDEPAPPMLAGQEDHNQC